MIDVGLIAAAKKAVFLKPRNFVTPAILLAVAMQESRCVPYFVDIKPGSLYRANVADAVTHKIRNRQGALIRIVDTGLIAAEIMRWVQIAPEIDGWKVPAMLACKPAKFRFEYGYWIHPEIRDLPSEQRFRMSCSWGLVQFMGPNIIGSWKGDGDPGNGDSDEDKDRFIRRFAADLPLQLLYGAGMLDQLLTSADGDLNHAYRGYNSGKIDSQDPAVIHRAEAVVSLHRQIQLQLGANHV